MPKCELLESISLHVQKLNCQEGVYELEDHVGEMALSLNLLPKLGLAKITPLTNYFSHLLKCA